VTEEEKRRRGKAEIPSSPFLPFSFCEIYLRDATNNDTTAIANIITLAFEEHRGRLEPPSSSLNKTPESVRQELQSANAIVAIKDNQMIGCVFYSLKDSFVYLAHLAVLPEHRGLGIAKALMQKVEEKALEHHHTTIRLSVRLALEKTRNFYERMGYSFLSYGLHPGFTQPTYVTLERHL
jgi:ribosomal protein S18 acetylase RimI-like enzyme